MITPVLVYQDTVGGSTQNVTRSISVPSVANGLLIVLVAADQVTGGNWPNSAISSITFNGVSLTQLEHDLGINTRSEDVACWYLVNPPAVTANVVVTRAGTVSGSSVTSLVFSGVNQVTPFNAHTNLAGAGGGSTTSTSLSIITSVSNAYLLDFICVGNTDTLTSGSNQSVLVGNTSDSFSKDGSTKDGTNFGLKTLSWSWTTTAFFAYIFISIAPVQAGGTYAYFM